MRSILVAVLAIVLTFAPAPLPAQDATGPVQEIELTDGSRVVGRIVSSSDQRVVIETVGGVRMEVDPAQIRTMREVQGRVVGGALWPEDPNATRLFFSPTARAVPAGQGYFGVFELFLPFIAYGVTDRLTISGGTPIIPDAIGEVFYLAPKLEVVRTPTASAAIGVFALFATQNAFDGTVGLLYGVGTFGPPDGAVTIGATVPFYAASGESDIGSNPAIMVGGEFRTGRRTKFLTESFFVPGESGALVSAGMRFFGERLSADFGLGAGFGFGESFCCLPLVNFVYTFGGSR
jgi:hypothetical protein